jgi:hypothetical protein
MLASSFKAMVQGLVACVHPYELDYRYTIALLTYLDLGTLEGLPPTIGSCPAAWKAAKKHDEDNPDFHHAMNGRHSAEYKEAMMSEVRALESKNTWH